MALQVFPESVIRSFSIQAKESFNTLSSQFEGENQQRQMMLRFPLRNITIPYNKIIDSQWPTLHSFFRKRLGGYEPFWLFATKQRAYVDEYIGRGGPFPLDGAIADDGGVQTDETDAANADTANGMILLPAVPQVGDRYYIIKKFMFDKATITIGIPGAGTWTVIWKYLKSDLTWAALSGVTDGTAGFTAAAGAHDVTFTIPSDWIDGIVKQRLGYAICAEITAYTSITTQPKGSGAAINTKTYDLPSKNTVNDASLKIYVNDLEKTGGGSSVQLVTEDGKQIVTEDGLIIVLDGEVAGDYSFLSAGGGGGADRISFAAYQTQGALITADLTGLLRIKTVLADDFNDDWFNQRFSRIQLALREVP